MRLPCSALCPEAPAWRPSPKLERPCWLVVHRRHASGLARCDCGAWEMVLPRRRAYGGPARQRVLPAWRAHVAAAMPRDPPRPYDYPFRKAYYAARYLTFRERIRGLQRVYKSRKLAERKARDVIALAVGHA